MDERVRRTILGLFVQVMGLGIFVTMLPVFSAFELGTTAVQNVLRIGALLLIVATGVGLLVLGHRIRTTPSARGRL
jgi:hypothetical protein